MRLLILDQFSDLGGAQQVLLELLPAVRRRGWEACVGLPGEGALSSRIRALGFDVARIACGPYASGRKTLADMVRMAAQAPHLALQIRGLTDRFRPDLVYINGPRLLPGAALANVPAPVLFHAHSYLPSGPSRTLAGKSLRRLGARVVGSCRFVAGLWNGVVPSSRISVIYNGVAGHFADGLRRAHNPYVVGCIGRIAPEKGQREFVAAAARIHAALPNCRFVIYGAPLFADEGARRYYEEVRAAASGLPVEFAGWVDDVRQAMANLDLLLAPSASHEATPRVILEAFTAGVPVIAFRSGGIPELIEDGRTGLLADSPEEMTQLAIELLSGHPSRRAALARAAAESWGKRFTLDRFQQQILEEMRASGG